MLGVNGSVQGADCHQSTSNRGNDDNSASEQKARAKLNTAPSQCTRTDDEAVKFDEKQKAVQVVARAVSKHGQTVKQTDDG